MYIIGIDIGKNHHEASIVSPEGKQIGRSLRFATTHKGADSLMRFIFKNIGNSPCVFGMEATGHYWYPIYSFLKAKRYTIYVINPIQSDSLRKMYIRQTKNDSIDSFLIAEVIRFGQFGTTSMADENILAMRQLCRYRDSVISSRTEIKLRIGTIMEQIFPEYEKQFSSLWVSTSMGILEKYLTPENIENTPIDELFEIIKDKSHNRLTKAKAISIKEAAADTFGIKIAQDAFSFQLKQLIDRMNFLDKQIEALDIEIMKYYEQFDCYLHTIPGIGIIGAATILAEIGDISRFKNSSALVAFAGIDPTVRQSGEFNSTHNHMSKRGSPYLRHAIFLAATTCSFHNSPLNAYYKKKRDQGKHHLTATGAVARKLTTIIYAVLRDSKPYEPKKFC
ncbi:IS110 family transposase [Agathobacter rectalis]|jgi:transposase|uniref:IS110 family transposase n=3 Tax=Agathobacter rectalis TaxID=39491 RepID=A0A413QUX2_9FIRM|nr:IS110 family transposase [Agathobacter rectalis]RGZ71806.1 IS110 family transposase [Agathobacter rectalis]RHA03390.1 IS110 family transposase [Agathobacter rectalis]RHA11954.1 IS110 family transposase [Agathobacter rectalis]TYL50191.1 IS110 family transposase [Agathobacter rectalis]